MSRIIFHIDVNSAFLSWDAVDRLQHGEMIDLRNVPSIVGGDPKKRSGIVLAYIYINSCECLNRTSVS